jgi:hypothetical protein
LRFVSAVLDELFFQKMIEIVKDMRHSIGCAAFSHKPDPFLWPVVVADGAGNKVCGGVYSAHQRLFAAEHVFGGRAQNFRRIGYTRG